MIHRISKHAARLAMAVVIATATGCGDADEAPDTAEVVEEPTPEERLGSAIDTWNATSSFHFVLQLENRVVSLDESGLLTYTSAEGDVVPPDRMQAQTTVRTPVGNTQVAFISIGDQQWLTNPLTRQWEAAPPGAAGAVARAFDPATGIGAQLAGMSDLQYHPGESLDGTPVFRLSGTLPGSVLAGFAADLAGVDRLNVDLMVTPNDNRIRRIVVRQPPAADGTVPTWAFGFSGFDQPVSIEPPL
jgi:hypothetical protein